MSSSMTRPATNPRCGAATDLTAMGAKAWFATKAVNLELTLIHVIGRTGGALHRTVIDEASAAFFGTGSVVVCKTDRGNGSPREARSAKSSTVLWKIGCIHVYI